MHPFSCKSVVTPLFYGVADESEEALSSPLLRRPSQDARMALRSGYEHVGVARTSTSASKWSYMMTPISHLSKSQRMVAMRFAAKERRGPRHTRSTAPRSFRLKPQPMYWVQKSDQDLSRQNCTGAKRAGNTAVRWFLSHSFASHISGIFWPSFPEPWRLMKMFRLQTCDWSINWPIIPVSWISCTRSGSWYTQRK